MRFEYIYSENIHIEIFLGLDSDRNDYQKSGPTAFQLPITGLNGFSSDNNYF